MLKCTVVARSAACRSLLVVAALSSLLVISGCDIFGTHKKVQVPQLLLPLQSANRDRLIQEVNRLSTVKSIHGKVDIEFEDTSFASVGIAEKYRQVDGTVTLQRPGKIYLVIQFTFVDIAQMASDGEHFSVAVLKGDDKYRRFVKGTNSAVYSKLDTDGNRPARNGNGQKAEKETVRSLSNLRPQHLTDAFMIRPIDSNGSLVYAQSEFFQEEADTRPQARKGSRIMRGYYLLEEFSDSRDGLRLSRRFWFDRVNGIRLARIQTYDERGVLVTDVSYSSEKPLGVPAAAILPTTIELTRPQDQYKIRISYQDPNTVDLNKEYPPEAFVLLNKWQLPEVDLDAGTNKKISINH